MKEMLVVPGIHFIGKEEIPMHDPISGLKTLTNWKAILKFHEKDCINQPHQFTNSRCTKPG